MSTWKEFRKKPTVIEMRPYVKGELLQGVSVSEEDMKKGLDSDMGMIARNPDNPLDMWYVNREYFEKHYEEA